MVQRSNPSDARPSSRALTQFVMRAAGSTFLLRLFYLASGFITTLLLTRWLGADGLGVYNFVISWVVLSVIFVKFGFEDFLVRETAVLQSQGDFASAIHLWRFTIRFVLVGALLAITIFAISLSFFTFETQNLRLTFWIGLMMIPLLGLIGIYRGRFRANKLIVNAQIPEYLIRPILLMLTVGALLLFRVAADASVAIAVNVGATLAALGFCIYSSWTFKNERPDAIDNGDKKTRTIDGSSDRNQWTHWVVGALPFVMIAGIHIINQRADRLMLGTMLDMKSVGFYSVAVQMSLVVNFPLLGINQAIGPLVAERHELNRSSELQQTLIRVTSIATAFSLGIVLLLALCGPWVLSIFGPQFQSSYLPMLILAVGQLANVAAGPAGAILSMSKRERLVGIGILVSAILNLIMNLALIPLLGTIGAAVATAFSMATWNIILVVFAKRQLGINSSVWAMAIPSRIQK